MMDDRTAEWMPSAPTTTSAVAVPPSAKVEPDLVALLDDTDAGSAQLDVAGLDPVEQRLLEVGPVHQVIRRVEDPPHLVAQRRVVEHAPVLPATSLDPFGLGGPGPQGLFEAEAVQQARRVGRELDAGADRPDLPRLLEDLAPEARAA
jgi:hypothetical protein